IKRSKIAIWLLILTTILWGTSFIITKNITKDVPIFLYLGLRFSIALFGFIPFFPHLKKLNKKIFWMGLITGLLYFFGIVFQTIGLQFTTAGKTGFITGLSTIIVPFLTWIGFKKPLRLRVLFAVILSVVGMAFLLLEGVSGLIIGDILVLICAFFFALYIVLNDKYVRLIDVYLYSIIQVLVISVLSFICSLLLQESYNFSSFQPSFWFVMIYMGIAVMTLTILFQNWSQQYQGPTITAIIFTLEPVFAVLFGFLIGSEVLSLYGWIGCVLIFIAILISVIKNKNKIGKVKETSP
ncbi:MAG: DMT family transporter, partial [Candidatus Lokiarchaeota archaeon]|nr:DMT family transporter [Candidatus Lokiarchaeota archaeon]